MGVSRTLAAAVEQCHDEAGIIWPMPIAPAHIAVIALTVNDDLVHPAANALTKQLAGMGFEVCIDDRKERPGVKFAEADLIGWPLQVTVGKRGLEAGTVEVKVRSTGEKFDVALEEIDQKFGALYKSMLADEAHPNFEALK